MNYHRLVYFCKLVNHFCNHWETPKQAVVSGWSDFPLVLPQSRLTFFWEYDIAWELRIIKLPKYLGSWSPPETERSHFGPKESDQSLSRWPWLQNQFGYHWFCNWCYILTNLGLILSVQNVTLRFLGVAASQIFLVIYLFLFLTLFHNSQKCWSPTMATLLPIGNEGAIFHGWFHNYTWDIAVGCSIQAQSWHVTKPKVMMVQWFLYTCTLFFWPPQWIFWL